VQKRAVQVALVCLLNSEWVIRSSKQPLQRLECLLLVEQGPCELLDLAPLLRGRFGRKSAQRPSDEPLALGLHEGRTLGLQTRDHAFIRRPDLLGGLDLLGP